MAYKNQDKEGSRIFNTGKERRLINEAFKIVQEFEVREMGF